LGVAKIEELTGVKLTFEDVCVSELIRDLQTSKKTPKIDGFVRLPKAAINSAFGWNFSPKTILTKINRLIAAGVVDRHPQSSELSAPLYRLGENADFLQYTNPADLHGGERPQPPQPEKDGGLFPDVSRETPNTETSSGIVKAETSSEIVEAEITPNAFVEFFNDFAKKYGLKTVREISETRRKKIKKILTDYPPETIKEVFQNIRDSDFLRGSKGWKLTFDFLIEKSNFIKILEGAYSGKKTSGIEKMVNNLDLSVDIAELETF
jgi:hypothetical protein